MCSLSVFIIVPELTHPFQTHQKHAMVCHSAYAGLPSMSPSKGPHQEPYTLTMSVATVADLMSNCKCNLYDTIEQEVGEGSEIAYDHITSHNSAYYYSHFL